MHIFKPNEKDKPLEYYTSKNPYLEKIRKEIDDAIEKFVYDNQNSRKYVPEPSTACAFKIYVKAEPLLFEEIRALLLYLLDKHIKKVYGNCFGYRKCIFSKRYEFFSAGHIACERGKKAADAIAINPKSWFKNCPPPIRSTKRPS